MVLYGLIVLGVILLICLTVIVISGVYITIDARKWYQPSSYEHVRRIIVSCIISVLATFFSVPTFMCIKARPETVVYEVLSVKANTDLQASFFLGSGAVNSKLYYYVLVEEEYGYMVKKISTENLYIIETDEITPRYTTQKLAMEYSFIYRLYVPENTVVINYYNIF